jgi:hypothetical protein
MDKRESHITRMSEVPQTSSPPYGSSKQGIVYSRNTTVLEQHSSVISHNANHAAGSNEPKCNPNPNGSSPPGCHMDRFVSDVLEFVRGIMDESPSLDLLTQNFNNHHPRVPAVNSSDLVAMEIARHNSTFPSNHQKMCSSVMRNKGHEDPKSKTFENHPIDPSNITIKEELDTESGSSWLGYVHVVFTFV